MASLYIKDGEAAELADEVATLRGVTKTTAVKDALRKERDILRSVNERKAGNLVARLERFWRENPLGEPTGLPADKAFYDSLNDEDEG